MARVDYGLSGRVVEVESGAPLSGVPVRVIWPARLWDSEDPLVESEAVTDDAGRYWVSLPALVPATYALGLPQPIWLWPETARGTTISSGGRSLTLGPGSALSSAPDGSRTVELQAPDLRRERPAPDRLPPRQGTPLPLGPLEVPGS